MDDSVPTGRYCSVRAEVDPAEAWGEIVCGSEPWTVLVTVTVSVIRPQSAPSALGNSFGKAATLPARRQGARTKRLLGNMLADKLEP
jgi:hypothetical protein